MSPVRIWLGIIGSQVSSRDGPQPMDRLRDAQSNRMHSSITWANGLQPSLAHLLHYIPSHASSRHFTDPETVGVLLDDSAAVW